MTPQLVPLRAQIVCGPAPEPQTSLLIVYPLLVQLSHWPVPVHTASEGTPGAPDVGLGLVVRLGVGEEVVRDAVGEPVDTPPVQATPLREKLAGTGLLLVHEALKPNE